MKQKNLLVIAIALCVLFINCSKKESGLAENANSSLHTPTAPINYTTSISIQNSAFNPATVTVMVNGSILWVNKDNMVHTVTADNGSFDSGDLPPGTTFGFTFNVVGPHSYHCRYHGEARGVVKCVTK